MKPGSLKKYRHFKDKFRVDLPDRQWPDRFLTQTPTWCSVDLRDGNQALPIPMSVAEKRELFDLLVAIGFKEIEVGFPSASETEYAFMRHLIDAGAVPDDVSVQVLVQARDHLIKRTFESLKGFRRGIIHLYNSTSRLQRKVTFGDASMARIKQIAVDGTKLVRELADWVDTEIAFQYSPESFSDTEIDYALEVCQAVMAVWEPTAARPMILNLPVTVEWTTPNYHADQIEWFCRQLEASGCREQVRISLHTHNDRGTGIACTELGLMAGADRVEGTLFGNGERTGNLDIVTVALNLNSHGIDTGLDFSNLPHIRNVYERVTRMHVPPRQPYGGDLVFTAFSGSHQDAIKKGMDRVKNTDTSDEWAVPYLTLDPEDIGRSYEAIIRINSQSGKGGVAWVLEREYGLELPKAMQPDAGTVIGAIADSRSRELTPKEIHAVFQDAFVNREDRLKLIEHEEAFETTTDASGQSVSRRKMRSDELAFRFRFACAGATIEETGYGNGPINAFVHALEHKGMKNFRVTHYASHAIGSGSDADAAAYVEIAANDDHQRFWGCGVASSIESAGLRALVSAINRLNASQSGSSERQS